MKRQKTRVISLTLVLLMAIGIFPVFLSPTTEVEASKNSQFDDFIQMDDEPAGFDPQNTNNPYGYGIDQPFLLVEQNELLLYQTYDLDKDNRRAWTTYYEGFDKGKVTDSVASGKLDVAVNFWSEKGSFAGYGTFADTRAYGYVQAVAFDATGSGRRDHVAYVGYDYQTKKVVTWVQDAREHNRKTAVKVLGTAEWIATTQGENGLGQYKANNFFAITAGDYDGDGQETYVVYIPGDGVSYGLSEIRLTSSFGLDYKDSSYTGIQDYLHSVYWRLDASLANDNKTRHKLCAALATGDFNGDGIDDLAVLSYMNRPESDKQKYDSRLYAPFLATINGAKGSGTILKKPYDSAYIRESVNVEDGRTNYHSMIAPGIAAGDVNGDGFDDLVVGGVKNTIRTGKNTGNADGAYTIDNDRFSVALFTHASTLSDFSLENIETSKWHQSGFYPSGDDVWQQTALETVAIDGKAAADYIFIQGGLYQVSPVDGTITEKLIPDYFTKKDSGAGSSVIGVAYIQSVAAGNFDDNEGGREQVVFVIGLRQSAATTSSDYYFRLGMIGGDEYEDTADSYGPVKSFYANDIDRGQYFIDKKGDKLKQTLNAVVVAVDRDQDGLMGRYKGMDYSYSDPAVLAALQAAPWFGELGSWGDYQGRTSYGFSQTYGFSRVKSETRSFGLSYALDFQFAVGLKVSFQEGYTGEWSRSFQESLEESYSSTFTAGAFDTVVLYRTPIVMYCYDLMVDGKWTENAVGLAFPQQPSYVQWSLDDYNTFVDYYNAYAADLNRANPDKLQIQLLNRLEDDYLGNEGNPWGYRSSWTGTDAVSLSKTNYSLGHAGGQTTSAYSYLGSETTGFENSNGYRLSLSVQGGSSVGGNEAWAGVAMQFASSEGYGEYTTVAKGTETSGTVFDINKYRLFNDEDIPLATSESYKFNWTFGKWSFKPGGASHEKTPVLGYALTGLRAPVPKPRNLAARLNPDDAAGSVILTWEKPDEKNRLKADGYNIYQKKGKEAFERVNAVPLSSDSLTYTVTGLENNSDYTYMVKAFSHESPESIPSNTASVRTAGSNYRIIFDLNENDVTVDARHTGNLPIQSGDQIPIDSIVDLKLTPKKDRTITRVELEVKGKRRDITNVAHEYNFIVQGDTRVIVTSKMVTVFDAFEIEYTGRYEGPDAAEIGRVHATAGDYPFSSGATVYGPAEFTAAPSKGYVLEKWIVTTDSEVSDYMANGENVWLFMPYAAAHKVEARFVREGDPSVNRKLTLTEMEGGGILVNGVRTKDQTLTLPVGTLVTLKPDPDAYYAFRMWTDDLVSYGSSAAPVSLALTDDMIVGARFYAPVKYAVTFFAVQAGDLAAAFNGLSIQSGAQLLPGSSLVLEAKAHPGSRLEKWRITKGAGITEIPVEGLVTQTTYKIDNLQNKYDVQAFFKEIEEYRLTVHLAGDGSVRILRDGRELADGDPVYFYDLLTIAAVPGAGSVLDSLLVNGTALKSGASLRVGGDVSIDAAFMVKNEEAPKPSEPSASGTATTSATKPAGIVIESTGPTAPKATTSSHNPTSAPDERPGASAPGTERSPATTETGFATVAGREEDSTKRLVWMRIALIILALLLTGLGILLTAVILKRKKGQG